MKIIVGLGNPGKAYERTPHNAGFFVIDELALQLRSKGLVVEDWHIVSKEKSMISEVYTQDGKRVVVLVKPQTFMNLSGGAVQQVMSKYGVKNPEDVLVVYDELDILLGSFKYSPIKNSKTHKGISSVMNTVGKSVQSLRIGIESRTNRMIPGEDFVLKPYSSRELQLLSDATSSSITLHVFPFLGLL